MISAERFLIRLEERNGLFFWILFPAGVCRVVSATVELLDPRNSWRYWTQPKMGPPPKKNAIGSRHDLIDEEKCHRWRRNSRSSNGKGKCGEGFPKIFQNGGKSAGDKNSCCLCQNELQQYFQCAIGRTNPTFPVCPEFVGDVQQH
jgi:hypothetical protein